jgi:cobyrinic acid a,c-diamide synthase
MKGLLIAGTSSGVGKTTVTLALLAAMRRRGMSVQPFKGGPDFLDTGHHSRIAGRVARNLDTWMLSHEANSELLEQASQGADAIIVEGMMGLFDGKDGITEAGSSAEIAKLLKLPVVLVLDASKTARSIAATVLGFESFDTELALAGIILNKVASERHFKMLETAIKSACRTRVFGWLPREAAIAIPERHLGLHAAEELDDSGATERQIEVLAGLAETHLDLNALFSLECGLDFEHSSLVSPETSKDPIRIGVARDRAFCFYYEDNLDLLRRNGAELLFFSPLTDESLPSNLDALYLGGGYPELYAETLSTNHSMLGSIRAFAASGRPIYAECGGMIYLARQLASVNEQTYGLAGVLPLQFEMTNKLVQFGYVTLELTRNCILGPVGARMRGHSFHYSRVVDHSLGDDSSVETSYRVEYSLSKKSEDEGYRVGNILASYIHLHFRSAPTIAQHFVETIRKVKATEFVWA